MVANRKLNTAVDSLFNLFGHRSEVTALDEGTVTVAGAVIEDELRIRTTEDTTIRDTVLEEEMSILSNDILSLQNVVGEERVRIIGDLDVYVFDSTFFEDVHMRLGAGDNTVSVQGSDFSRLVANGRGGVNVFDDLGDNDIDELVLFHFIGE